MTTAKNALSTQEGGSHYKDMKIQPVEFIHANGIGFCEATAIKYLCRWRKKGGIQDLKKAKHFIDVLIELETRDTPKVEVKDGPYCILCDENLADFRYEIREFGVFYYCSNCCAELNISTAEMTVMGTL